MTFVASVLSGVLLQKLL